MKKVDPINIRGVLVGGNYPPFIVAEMSGNHNGDIGRARALIKEAKKAGAHAVKLQTYTADTITIDHDGPEFVLDSGLWSGRRLHELYAEAHTPWEWHPELFRLAEEIGITLFSAPFDNSAIDFLEDLNCPAYKIASPELIDLPLISRAAETGKPLILSTGMATEEEISEAIEVARSKKTKDVVVLHCTSSYPASLSDANLRTIPAIAKKHNVNVGLSDHTEGILASIMAVALGACMVEKHFTLKRADGGVDSAFSLETQELKALVSEVSRANSTLGQPSFQPLEAEQMVLANRRSLYVTSAIARGEKFTLENVRSIRPGKGLKPKYLQTILGKTAARAINFGEPLDETMITEKIR